MSLSTPEVQLPRVGVECPTGDEVDWKKAWFTLAAERNRDVSVLLSKLSEIVPPHRHGENGQPVHSDKREEIYPGADRRADPSALAKRLRFIRQYASIHIAAGDQNTMLDAADFLESIPSAMPAGDKEGETPRVNRMLCSGRLRQNDGYYTDGGEWVRAHDARQLECELAAMTADRDMRLADYAKKNAALGRVIAERDALLSAHTALKQLVEAVDGMADMDEADGPEFFEAERRLESAMENAKRCLYVGERT